MSGKTTKATTEAEAPPPQEARVSLASWCADHAVMAGPDGTLVDHRITGLIGGFEFAMREAGKRGATPSEFEAEWKKFLRRKM